MKCIVDTLFAIRKLHAKPKCPQTSIQKGMRVEGAVRDLLQEPRLVGVGALLDELPGAQVGLLHVLELVAVHRHRPPLRLEEAALQGLPDLLRPHTDGVIGGEEELQFALLLPVVGLVLLLGPLQRGLGRRGAAPSRPATCA